MTVWLAVVWSVSTAWIASGPRDSDAACSLRSRDARARGSARLGTLGRTLVTRRALAWSKRQGITGQPEESRTLGRKGHHEQNLHHEGLKNSYLACAQSAKLSIENLIARWATRV
jgi:hypothetical protein